MCYLNQITSWTAHEIGHKNRHTVRNSLNFVTKVPGTVIWAGDEEAPSYSLAYGIRQFGLSVNKCQETLNFNISKVIQMHVG